MAQLVKYPVLTVVNQIPVLDEGLSSDELVSKYNVGLTALHSACQNSKHVKICTLSLWQIGSVPRRRCASGGLYREYFPCCPFLCPGCCCLHY